MSYVYEFRHGTRLNWNRDFYKLEDQTGNVSTVTLNIFQRILRATLGIIATWINKKFCYADTIISQKRINPFEKIQDKEVVGRIKKLVQDLWAVGKGLNFDGLGLGLLKQEEQQQALQRTFLQEQEQLKQEEEVLQHSEEKLPPSQEEEPKAEPEVKKDPKTVNVLIVGAQPSGKTVLKDLILKTFPIVKAGVSYEKTQNPTESEIMLSGHKFRIIDTPGLKSNEKVDDCIHAVQKKAQQVFGGKGFENVDVVLMTCTRDVSQMDLLAINGFYRQLTDQTRKFMVFNHAEFLLSAETRNARIETFLDRGYEQPFSKDEILFSGAIDTNDLVEMSERFFSDQLETLINLRENLINAMLPSSMTKDEKAEFVAKRREEFILQGKTAMIEKASLPLLVGLWLKKFESMIQSDKHLSFNEKQRTMIDSALVSFKRALDACQELDKDLSAGQAIWVRLRASLIMSIYFKGSESQKGYLNEVFAHIEKFELGALRSSVEKKSLSELVGKCLASAANLGEEDKTKLEEFQRKLAA